MYTGTLEEFVSQNVGEENRASVLRAFEELGIRNVGSLQWLDRDWFSLYIPAPAGEQIWFALMVRCIHDYYYW
jgi:hypothetical protein